MAKNDKKDISVLNTKISGEAHWQLKMMAGKDNVLLREYLERLIEAAWERRSEEFPGWKYPGSTKKV